MGHRFSVRAFGVLLCTVALAAPALAETPSATVAPPAAAVLANIRIDNFGKVNDDYYRGAQPKGRDYNDLAALGVKTVIDLQEDGPSNEAGFATAVVPAAVAAK